MASSYQTVDIDGYLSCFDSFPHDDKMAAAVQRLPERRKDARTKVLFFFLRLSSQEGKYLTRLILIIRPLHHMLSVEFIMMEGKWSRHGHIRP